MPTPNDQTDPARAAVQFFEADDAPKALVACPWLGAGVMVPLKDVLAAARQLEREKNAGSAGGGG